jgi:hypothetical protein
MDRPPGRLGIPETFMFEWGLEPCHVGTWVWKHTSCIPFSLRVSPLRRLLVVSVIYKIIGPGGNHGDLPILAALLIVQNDVDGDLRSTRPLGIGIFAFIPLEVSIPSTERDILLNTLF